MKNREFNFRDSTFITFDCINLLKSFDVCPHIKHRIVEAVSETALHTFPSTIVSIIVYFILAVPLGVDTSVFASALIWFSMYLISSLVTSLDSAMKRMSICLQNLVEEVTGFCHSRLNNALQKINYFSIMGDSSNHREIKVVPLLVRYFDSEKGIQVKL